VVNHKKEGSLKKLVLLLAAGVLSVTLAGSAGATPITFTDTTKFYSHSTDPNVDLNSYGGKYVNKLEHKKDWVTWTHHFGYSPPALEVLAGTITIYLKDNENDVPWWWWTYELGMGWGEDATWDFGEVQTGDYSYNVTASYLEDGEFQVTVASQGGDFFICQSDLKITYEPVPEASTLMLFGSGLSGLAFWVRRRKVLRS
jgi:hypothetical protein